MSQSDSAKKAYLVEYVVTNKMQALVYGDNAADARRRWSNNETVWEENTGDDGRLRGVRVRRCADEDLP